MAGAGCAGSRLMDGRVSLSRGRRRPRGEHDAAGKTRPRQLIFTHHHMAQKRLIVDLMPAACVCVWECVNSVRPRGGGGKAHGILLSHRQRGPRKTVIACASKQRRQCVEQKTKAIIPIFKDHPDSLHNVSHARRIGRSHISHREDWPVGGAVSARGG